MSDNPIDGDPYGLRAALNGGFVAGPLDRYTPDWTDRLLGQRQWQPIPPNPLGGGDFPPRQLEGMHSHDLLGGSDTREVVVPGESKTPDMTDQYNTELPAELEQKFQAWLKQSGKAHDLFDYDLRGAWLSGSIGAAGEHSPDTWKKPNHPTFSDMSRYSTPEMPGGQWQQSPDGTWSFTATDFNLKMNPRDQLQRYWNEYEGKNKLILPDIQAQAGAGQQFAGNLRVPPDSMQDSPRYLVIPDAGDEPPADTRSVQEIQAEAARADWRQKKDAALKAMEDAYSAWDTGGRKPELGHRLDTALDDLDAVIKAAPDTPWVDRMLEQHRNVKEDADVMMRGVFERQILGREEPQS